MSTRRRCGGDRRWPKQAVLALPLLAMLGMPGCAQFNKLTSWAGRKTVSRPSATFTPVAAPKPAEPVDTSPVPSLKTIVRSELQRGRYAEGEKALHRFLARHPDDRAAQAVLRQLTADPQRVLGQSSRAHVVQPGESYGSLAARYLGDANLFLILARYNGSTNPSMLRVGQTLRLPVAATGISRRMMSGSSDAPERHVASRTSTDATAAVPAAAAATGLPAAETEQLQKESLALLGQGHQQQALARLDQALLIDPQLKPADPEAAALRKQLLASYHQRAIVLYRDQQLDQAIALWDRVLAIDPNYEAAAVYRTRALELKRRLKQL
jgi:tetratricopeptide (TPR) repeat protein